MIDSIADLDLKSLDELKEKEEILKRLDEILSEKLNITLNVLKGSLADYLVAHAEELALELPNIAPFANYGKLIEDNDGMADFLKKEASKSEHWMIKLVCSDEKFDQLIKFVFICKAIDEGESVKGTVFVSKAGVVRHAFVQAN